MHIDFSPEQRAFQDELRRYFADLVTPDVIDEIRKDREGGGPLYHETLRRMGRDGYLGIGWPVEYGGRGAGVFEQIVWSEEYARAWAPDLIMLAVGTSLVGPVLISKGKPWQRERFLEKILR